jgi:hypothetical protein
MPPVIVARLKNSTALTRAHDAPAPDESKADVPADDAAAPEKITYEDAVAEGKRLVAETATTTDRNDWRIAELADLVVTHYRENPLAKFASEIGLNHCTVQRRLTTYRNWKEIRKADPGLLLSYSVARALEKHPERERLIRANPTMTKRQATKLMKAHHRKPENETQKWWKNMLKRSGKAMADESIVKAANRQDLLKVVEPTMLSTLRDSIQTSIRVLDFLEKLFQPNMNDASDDAWNEASPDGPA